MNVLLCDDHRIFVDALAVVLAARGYRVVGRTTTPREAIEAVQTEVVDVCLLDVQFPAASGVPAIEEILAASPASKVVVLTASTDGHILRRALMAGARGVAVKSDDLDSIVEVLDRVGSGDLVVQGAALHALAVLPEAGLQRPAQELLRFLTERERQVLERLVLGYSTARLAQDMGVRYSTVRTHIQNILEKLGVHSKLEAVALAVGEGLVPIGSPAGGPRVSGA